MLGEYQYGFFLSGCSGTAFQQLKQNPWLMVNPVGMANGKFKTL